ncbi:MAG: methylated-DNA--[protein]-cysteine S-methyltransferase [Promethearchaeota archaeon]
MPAIYFKSEKLDIYILIAYKEFKKKSNFILKEIKFFKNELSVIEYVNEKELSVIPQSELIQTTTIYKLKRLLELYLSGKKLNLFKKIKELEIDLELSKKFPTEFSKKVLDSVTNIKYGVTSSYSEVGKKINSKAYRAIGSALKKNTLPLIIPCHRIIKKNGSIGGFIGKTDHSWEQKLKMNLLILEKKGS